MVARFRPADRLTMGAKIRKLLRNERGATAIEYGLILTFIAMALLGAMTMLGSKVSSNFNNIAAGFG